MTPITVTLVAAGIPGSLASVIALWLFGRLLKAKKATFLRAITACLLIATFCIGAFLGCLAISDQLGELALWSLVPVMLAEFLFACLCICWLFGTTFGRAVLIWFLSTVSAGVLGFSLAFAGLVVLTDKFVVPTGAMSPAIYGVHCYKVCDHCGYRFAVGLSYRLNPGPSDTTVTNCTNCGRSATITPSDATISGDRIVSNKLGQPKRWDAIVFRPPDQPDTMYVMRLVGMPGEEIEIRDGDVFADGRRLRKVPSQVPELWLPVHDTAFTLTGPTLDNEPRWRSLSDEEACWQWDVDRGWQFVGETGMRDELAFSGPVLDQFAYNAQVQWGSYAGSFPDSQEWQNVRDIKVTCAVSQFRGDGQIGFNWGFGNDRVAARLSAAGDVEIVRMAHEDDDSAPDGGQEQSRSQGQLAAPLIDSNLTFAFRDWTAYVKQNDSVIASLAFDDDQPAGQANEADEGQQIGIFAEDCEVVLKRIQLFRDVHYLSAAEMEPRAFSSTSESIQLDDKQCWVLGDNSRQSKDSRFFGPVSSDSVKGVVDCIYWPPERWRRFGSP